MKHISITYILILLGMCTLFTSSCKKKDQAANTIGEIENMNAVSGMELATFNLLLYHDSVMYATIHATTHLHHYDSLFHHHDSVYHHHHVIYHHGDTTHHHTGWHHIPVHHNHHDSIINSHNHIIH